jgi:hypothetical protein
VFGPGETREHLGILLCVCVHKITLLCLTDDSVLLLL